MKSKKWMIGSAAALMIFCAACGAKNTEEVADPNDFSYEIFDFVDDEEEEEEAMVDRYYGDLEHIVIPTRLGGHIVKGICSMQEVSDNVKSIKIPDTVTKIEKMAFLGCSGLESIEFPDTVTQMDTKWMFRGCSSLESIKLPDSLTQIGEQAFQWCSSLKNIELPDSLTGIGHMAFLGCSSLKNIELPDSLTWIGSSAFMRCSSLESIELPDSLTWIASDVFEDCSSLTSIIVTSGSYAEKWAFENGYGSMVTYAE